MITIVFLHFLGGSTRTWTPLIAQLGDAIHPLPIDLPGFGDAATTPGSTVAEMAAHVAAKLPPTPFLIVGHSMGAKIACALARQAEDGALPAPSGLILIAGSPPSPEPMDETKRQEMLAWFQHDLATSAAQAQTFIQNNVTAPLPPSLQATATEDVLRADPARWRAWLTAGSNEDWSARIGRLQTPTLILAGADDPCLGPKAQATLMAPHFVQARQIDLSTAKHLLPLERTNDLATLIRERLP